MAVINATTDTFHNEVESGVALVDFWAPWCGPCKMISPVLDELVVELGDKAKIIKINVDENQDLAQQYDVMSIPALFVFKDGEIVDSALGFQPKEALSALVTKHL